MMLKLLYKCLWAGLFSLTLVPAQAQVTTWPILNLFFRNQFDKQGLHHGKWVVKLDVPADKTQTKIKGHYRHGYMVGTWHTYNENKKLLKLEKGSIENEINIIETIEYYPNGKVAKEGFAAIEFTNGKPHYYRYGPWTSYKEDASLDKTIMYDKGWPAKTTYANGKIETSHPPENNFKFYAPGEAPKIEKKAGWTTGTVDKEGRTILIKHISPTDSTITIIPPKPKDLKEED